MSKIYIFEMFMRDGLQSLQKKYNIYQKINFLNILIDNGIKNIEFGSTVDKKLLPQMDNSFDLWEYIKTNIDNNELIFTMLITSKKNLLKSIKNNIQSFGLLCALNDDFSIKNLNKNYFKSIQDMLDQLDLIYSICDIKVVHVRLYLSCFFSGNSAIIKFLMNKLINIINQYKIKPLNLDIVLCDTFGNLDLDNLEGKILLIEEIDRNLIKYIGLHLHKKKFLKFIEKALQYQITKFDSSIIEIGGCPFTGKEHIENINTITLCDYLIKNNYEININYEKLNLIHNEISNNL